MATNDASDGVDADAIDNRDREAFVTNDALIELLTPGAKLRILLALIRLRGEKLNPTGICERAAIDRDTWYRHKDDLVDRFAVIEEVEPAGNSPMYRVNMDHPIIERLSDIRDLAAAERNTA